MDIGGKRQYFLTAVLLLIIVAVAVFFRFTALDYAPPALYPDEAVNGINALEAQESGEFSVFYTENNGREGLFANIAGVAFGVFGMSLQTLRGVAGAFGVLMVIGLFFFVNLLWGHRLALLASYLSSVGFWAVNFSRIGFRAMILPAVLVWSFYFLFRGLKRSSWVQVGMGGLIFGVGLHSYISFRVAPLLLMLLLCGLLWYGKKNTQLFSVSRRQLLGFAGVFLVASLITAAPILTYWAANPGDFLGRAGQVSVFAADNPLALFGTTVVEALGMFSFVGDFNWRHNIAGRPLLGYGMGIMFILGLVVLIARLFRTRRLRDWFVFGWFFVLLLPNFFAPEGSPHALRAVGALPAVYIIAALGALWLYEYIQEYLTQKMQTFSAAAKQLMRIKREAALLALLLVLFAGVWEARAYFVRWAPRAETAAAFESELSGIAGLIQASRADTKIVIENSGGVAVQTIIFLTWEEKDTIRFVDENALSTITQELDDALIVLVHHDAALLQELEERFPEARALHIFDGIRIP